MCSPYLDEALRACRLPISVRHVCRKWIVEDTRTRRGIACDTVYEAGIFYRDLRDQMLAEQKENG